jgi:hypothetical protein
MVLIMPVLETDSTNAIDGIEHWARGNVTPASRNKIRHIVDAYAKLKDREFANVAKRWDIEWFWMVDMTRREHDPLRKQKEFYSLNLVNADTEKELWGYS